MRSNGQAGNTGLKNWKTDASVFAELVADAMDEAVREAIAEHHRAGNPVAIWRDGRIVMLYPDGSTRPLEPNQPALDAAE